MKLFTRTAKTFKRLAAKRAKRRARRKMARPIADWSLTAQVLWASRYSISNPTPPRSGVIRAAERLAEHRKIWADTPDSSVMTRQRKRAISRHMGATVQL